MIMYYDWRGRARSAVSEVMRQSECGVPVRAMLPIPVDEVFRVFIFSSSFFLSTCVRVCTTRCVCAFLCTK